MSTAAQAPGLRSVPRVTFGVLLFVAWGIETFFWVYATIHSAADGEVMPVVTAVAALALLVLLAGMEGLEVAVIDRWRSLYPERTTSDLAAWLAARQLFVALIVTTATLLAHRDAIIVPGSRVRGDPGPRPRPLRPHMDRVHRAVVRADLPEASGSDEPRPVPRPPASHALSDRRGRAAGGRLAARRVGGRESRAASRLACPYVTGIEEVPPAHEQSLATIWRELIPESTPPPPAREPRPID